MKEEYKDYWLSLPLNMFWKEGDDESFPWHNEMKFIYMTALLIDFMPDFEERFREYLFSAYQEGSLVQGGGGLKYIPRFERKNQNDKQNNERGKQEHNQEIY